MKNSQLRWIAIPPAAYLSAIFFIAIMAGSSSYPAGATRALSSITYHAVVWQSWPVLLVSRFLPEEAALVVGFVGTLCLLASAGFIASRAGSLGLRIATFGAIQALLVGGSAVYVDTARPGGSIFQTQRNLQRSEDLYQKGLQAQRREIAKPEYDFKKMYEDGGYSVRGVGKARPRDLLSFAYFVDAHAKDPGIERAVDVLKLGIRSEEVHDPKFVGPRAAAASAVFRVTGKKIYFTGVEKTLSDCARRMGPEPYDPAYRTMGKCSTMDELEKLGQYERTGT